VQVRVELSDEQRELYKVILGKNYEALVGELYTVLDMAAQLQLAMLRCRHCSGMMLPAA
jgi:hypothetical protein